MNRYARRGPALGPGRAALIALSALAAMVCAFALGAALADEARAEPWQAFLSPGAVGRSHAALEADCDSCHLVFEGVPDAKCLSCHDGLADRIQRGEGFHATLPDPSCIGCHPDHRGAEAALTSDAARRAFTHEATGFPLHGAHVEVPCETCHVAPVDQMDALCADCHPDPHDLKRGDRCQSCHSDTAWTDDLKTRADHIVPMGGGHDRLACEDCHPEGRFLTRDVLCADCHDKAHGGTRAPCDTCHSVDGFHDATFDHGLCTCSFPGAHQSDDCLACHEGFVFTGTATLCSECHLSERTHPDRGECSRCHTAVSWSEIQFDHAVETGFPIDGAHLNHACAECHETGGEPVAVSAECASCHAAAGDEAHGDFSAFGGCDACHTTAAWAPSTFDHGSTGFPLTGRHAEMGCQECHGGKMEGYPGR